MSGDTHGTGLRGEVLACAFLRENGCEVLATRFRAQGGEIDIIARDGTYLCFIEVKYRTDGRITTGMAAVTRDRRVRIQSAAQADNAQ